MMIEKTKEIEMIFLNFFKKNQGTHSHRSLILLLPHLHFYSLLFIIYFYFYFFPFPSSFSVWCLAFFCFLLHRRYHLILKLISLPLWWRQVKAVLVLCLRHSLLPSHDQLLINAKDADMEKALLSRDATTKVPVKWGNLHTTRPIYFLPSSFPLIVFFFKNSLFSLSLAVPSTSFSHW